MEIDNIINENIQFQREALEKGNKIAFVDTMRTIINAYNAEEISLSKVCEIINCAHLAKNAKSKQVKTDTDLVVFFKLKNGKYLTRSGYEITTEMILGHTHVIHENSGYIVLPSDSELIHRFIEPKYTDWKVGDVFITNFWSVREVCIIRKMTEKYVKFNRVESIRDSFTVVKDYCAAEMEIALFNKMKKTFIHHSEWHHEYKNEK